MRTFQGRVVTPGEVTAEAVVTTEGFNTLASFQMALQFGDKQVKCGDQNNRELHGKPLIGKALCLPQTIGSTTGGLVLYCACAMKKNPACMLFSNHIDSLAAAGAVLEGDGGHRGDLGEKKESQKGERAIKPVITLLSKNGY